MSGAIEVEINSSLLESLSNKVDELPDRFTQLVNESAFITQNKSVEEAPFITHNLETSIQISEGDGLFSRIVYPDEGIAPYALFVILGHMTRPSHVNTPMGKMKYGGGQHFVPGNPFFDRAQPRAEAEIEQEIADFTEWLKED